MGRAISFFSMAAGLGLGTLAGWFAGPWVAWGVAPLAASVGFMVLAGLEMALAGYYHDSGGVVGEFDE